MYKVMTYVMTLIIVGVCFLRGGCHEERAYS
jgi:hypothetical protein